MHHLLNPNTCCTHFLVDIALRVECEQEGVCATLWAVAGQVLSSQWAGNIMMCKSGCCIQPAHSRPCVGQARVDWTPQLDSQTLTYQNQCTQKTGPRACIDWAQDLRLPWAPMYVATQQTRTN